MTDHPWNGLQAWRSHCSCQIRGKGVERQGCSVGGGHDEVVAQEVEAKTCRPVELVKVVLTCGALELVVRVKQF